MFPNDPILLSMVKKTKYWKIDNVKASSDALEAIRCMLSRITAFWPREKGQGWDLPKFHEQLHIIDDIIQNAAPSASHTGPMEKVLYHLLKTK